MGDDPKRQLKRAATTSVSKASAKPPLRVSKASADECISKGVIKTKLDGVTVRMTNPAKTVADCFKYRRRVGLEVALEALREGLAERAFTPATFAKYAKMNRVLSFVRPYLESMS